MNIICFGPPRDRSRAPGRGSRADRHRVRRPLSRARRTVGARGHVPHVGRHAHGETAAIGWRADPYVGEFARDGNDRDQLRHRSRAGLSPRGARSEDSRVGPARLPRLPIPDCGASFASIAPRRAEDLRPLNEARKYAAAVWARVLLFAGDRGPVVRLRRSTADQVEQAAEPAVGVSLTCQQLRCVHQVF